ncbi:SRPBCC family protein [Paludibaculum fermentans]|uniref:SRPBCC family protein n=1 Tax=Paludibaculum fermentans TaxID=1473598 RepID=UPI003EB8DEA9
MQPTTESNAVSASVLSFASCDRLWRAWADPELLQQWFCDHAWGDIKVGGDYYWQFAEFDVQAHSRITELIPEVRMALESQGTSVVFHLAAEGHGSRMTVKQDWQAPPAPPAEARAEVRSGWLMSMALMRHYAENYFEQPKQTLLVKRAWTGSFAKVLPYYQDPRELRRWLKVAERPREILTDTGQEVCYRWDPVGGALEFKAFHWGGAQQLALRVTSWSKDYDLSFLKPQLEESLDHLQSLLIS